MTTETETVTLTVPRDATPEMLTDALARATQPEVRVGDVAWCRVFYGSTWLERVEGGWLEYESRNGDRSPDYAADEVTVLRVIRPLPDGHIAVKVPERKGRKASTVAQCAKMLHLRGYGYAACWLEAIADALDAQETDR